MPGSFQVVANIGAGTPLTLDASRLAAKLGLEVEELHARLRHCYGVYERGVGEAGGCLTVRYGPRSWAVTVRPGNTVGDATTVAAPLGQSRGWLVSLSWRGPSDTQT